MKRKQNFPIRKRMIFQLGKKYSNQKNKNISIRKKENNPIRIWKIFQLEKGKYYDKKNEIILVKKRKKL